MLANFLPFVIYLYISTNVLLPTIKRTCFIALFMYTFILLFNLWGEVIIDKQKVVSSKVDNEALQ